ncbi:hypothetical protein BO94DRAFT_544170 [Aspergillus sclerotioniger CBS 115572]|uniref:DUF6987 domain-containing protein n=1 Tax=Aspergillus sclerotioniger CBS 115572 TaxID=1450535 RepID=A0A317X3I9_9EURO|nr:hypothetical protein BO94DRAFT_544170 [Aspergillus sclerotioniger CBS 115572]PWY93126.1 hypothetical protein BO94DRAFT_544170 [Aspergillus sclerotioniger CBS 115572]
MATTNQPVKQPSSLGRGEVTKEAPVRKQAPPELPKTVGQKGQAGQPALDEGGAKLQTKTVDEGQSGQFEGVDMWEVENLDQQRQVPEQRQAMPPETATGSASSHKQSFVDRSKAAAGRLGRFAKGAQSVKDHIPQGITEQTSHEIGDQEVGDRADGLGESRGGVGLDDTVPKPNSSDIKNIAKTVGDLKGLSVDETGKIVTSTGQPVGKVIEGDPKDLIGQIVGEGGEILDEDGDLIGRVDVLADDELEPVMEDGIPSQPLLPDISTLEGLQCTKFGSILNAQGTLVGELVEGDAKRLFRGGFEMDDKGQFWDHRGNIIGKAWPVPPDVDEISPFEGVKDLHVGQDGWVLDEDGRRVGQVVKGEAKKLEGRAVDEDGDILDRRGNRLGRAEPWQEPDEPEKVEEVEEKPNLSCLSGLKATKLGLVIGPDQVPMGKVIEGDPRHLAGKTVAPDGQIWGDQGEVIGRVELIPENERKDLMRPFQGEMDLMVNGSGWVEDDEGKVVGRVVEGDPKALQGYEVDEDGEIVDQHGTVLGRAERCEPPAETVEEPDLSVLGGKLVNKMGNVVDADGVVIGRLVTGNPRKLAGKSVDDQGQVWDSSGHVVGQAEVLPDAERDRPEGPFCGLDGLTLDKEGMVVNPSGTPVGRLVQGDVQRLAGRAVDEDGEVLDGSGNVIGRAEPWASPEEPASPMTGHKVNREGEVRDEGGNLIGKVTEGDLSNLVGRTVDKDGYVMDSAGNKIGQCTLLDNLPPEPMSEPEPEPEPELEPEISPEELEQQARQAEENELAKKMCSIVQQTLDSVEPICRLITQHIERANGAPKEDLDEEELVKQVKPLIEEAGYALQECKGALRALDPDGHITANAKAHSASQEATPQEHHLAELLKNLTKLVTETIERGKSLIADMPHAKKELNPLWALLSEPLFQIIAAVGLLLSGVLGLVSNLLDGLGLGGLLRGLLGGLGVDKLLEGLGLGTITQGLGLGGKK